MIVHLRNIPHNKPLQVKFEIHQEALHADEDTLARLPVDEIFKQAAQCSMTLIQKHRDDDVMLSGSMECCFETSCYRCAKFFEYTFKDEHVYLLCAQAKVSARAKRKNRVTEDDFEDQDGLVFFKDDVLDLSKILKQHMLLNLPMRYLCQEDCQGLCKQCGGDLNFAQHTCMKSV